MTDLRAAARALVKYDDDTCGTGHHFDEFIAALRAALSEPEGEGEPVAWLIEYRRNGDRHRIQHLHNAVGDYRTLDPQATSTPLCKCAALRAKAGS